MPLPRKLPSVPTKYPIYETMRQHRAEQTCLAAAQIPGDVMYDERVVTLTKQIEQLEQQRLKLLWPSIQRFREMYG